jgi:hypothetical protein
MTPTARLRRHTVHAAMAVLALALSVVLAAPPALPAAGGGEYLRPAALPSTAPTSGPITIGTMPPVVGYPVIFDGVTRLTDGLGTARFLAPRDGKSLRDRVTLTDANLTVDGRPIRVRGNRVYDSSTGPMIGLDISYPVQFHFSTLKGSPIDDSLINVITLKSTNGEVVELPANDTAWLHGTRAVQILGGLQVKQVSWSVQRVEFAGSNVVNSSQQAFQPADKQDVDVEMLFFSAQFDLRDAMFDFSRGGAIELGFPDGTSRRFSVGADGLLSLPALPRGDYTLTTLGGGPSMSRPLTISRDLKVELEVYSWLDIMTALGVALGAAAGLAWWGRVRRGRGRARRRIHYADTRRVKTPGAHRAGARIAAEEPDRHPGHDAEQPSSEPPAMTLHGG